MIRFAPTGLAIGLVLVAAPAAVLIGLAYPAAWLAAPLWAIAVAAMVLFDALAGAAPGRAALSLAAPKVVGVGEPFDIVARVGGIAGALRRPSLAIAIDGRLAARGRLDAPLTRGEDGTLGAVLPVSARRRGSAPIEAAWLGWTGPLGLARKQARFAQDSVVAIVPSIQAVRDEGAKLFARDAMIGQRLNARLGEGSEFESLVRFMPGLDRRSIDWKQSARHADLLAKQFETERDNRVVFAIDAGRMMSEPLAGVDGVGEPRLDRAIAAALTLAYVALRLEDRVSLASFAARPRFDPREYVRLTDFAAVRRAAADIDYRMEETNFTLGLASIGAALKRRAMVVVFTEFADANSAELMIAAAQRLVRRHLLVFVVMADSELETLATQVPDTAQAMAAATIAADLLRDRRLVLSRLRRMGALVVEAPADGVPARLIAAYIRIKRQGMI